MGFGTLNHPGAGLSALVFLKGMPLPSDEVGNFRFLGGGTRWFRGICVVTALLSCNITFPYLGFILCKILLLFFLFKVNGLQKWFAGVAGALIASLYSDAPFARWLEHSTARVNCQKTAFLTRSTGIKKGSLNGFLWDPVLRFFCRPNSRVTSSIVLSASLLAPSSGSFPSGIGFSTCGTVWESSASAPTPGPSSLLLI